MTEKLKIIDYIPEGFLEIKPKDITQLISAPALIHLRGKKERAFFISILLHGNEFSGLIILQRILQKYRRQALPMSLILFIANPQACAQGLRQLKGQPDFNRIWKGGSLYEESLIQPVLRYARDQNIRGAIDIHNNSGKNPVYACINKQTEEAFRLAQAFSEKIVYFTKPDTVLSMALSEICPSVVIECGLPGDSAGIASGVQLMETILDPAERWKKGKIKDISVYHTRAALHIDPDTAVSFHSRPFLKEGHLCFVSHLDEFNFKLLKAGAVLGKISDPKQIRLLDKSGLNIFDQFFEIVENNLTVKSPFIPCMLTKNAQIAKSDCLGYIMKKEQVAFHV